MRRRRNKRLSFGFVNCVLALALVVATIVVTQTSALQYLKEKLAGGSEKNMTAAMSIPGKARMGDVRPLITLKNAVKGRKNGQLLVKTGYVLYFNYERNNPDWVAWELTSDEAYGRLDRDGYEFVSDDALFSYQKQIIKNLADTESCVIVGKCADYILAGRPNVISVYIEAPRDFCIKRTMANMGVTEEVAAATIKQTDAYRAEYYKYYTHGNYWTNPINYDMTLNSERVGIDECVELIKSYMRIKGLID